jgi:type II secretory pathway pseudopilin PulG
MKEQRIQSGYTMVDTLVSLALFSIVILVCVGVLATIVNSNRKERSLKQAMDNLNVVMENISRTVKTGSKYYCSSTFIQNITPCAGTFCITEARDCHKDDSSIDGTHLALRDKNGNVVLYWFDNNYNNDGNHCVAKAITNLAWSAGYGGDGSVNYSCITDPDVTITNFRFYVYNTKYFTPSDSTSWVQPRVIFIVQGYAGSGLTKTNFNLMTSATQRAPHNGETD